MLNPSDIHVLTLSRSQGHSPTLLKVTQHVQLLQWWMIVWLLREQSSLLWNLPSLLDSQLSSWEVSGRQPSLSLTMMVELLLFEPAACIISLHSLCITFAVVSVGFANRSIEVSEGVGEVTVCLLRNSTTAMDFNLTVTSVGSSPVSAEGLHRNIGLNQYNFSLTLTLSLSYLLSLGGADFEEVSRTFSFPTRNDIACTTITVVDDRVALEGAEQFTVELTLPSGQPALQLGNNRQTTITITDNDGKNCSFIASSCLKHSNLSL